MRNQAKKHTFINRWCKKAYVATLHVDSTGDNLHAYSLTRVDERRRVKLLTTHLTISRLKVVGIARRGSLSLRGNGCTTISLKDGDPQANRQGLVDTTRSFSI